MRILTIVVSAVSLLLPVAAGVAEELVIDRFPLASGPPRFGEGLAIQGTIVTWDRCWEGRLQKEDTIQYKDLARLGTPEVDVIEFPCKYASVLLGPTHLFWCDEAGEQLLARPIETFSLGVDVEPIVVGRGRRATTAASRTHV